MGKTAKTKPNPASLPELTKDGALHLAEATPDKPVVVQVIDLLRYIVDDKFLTVTQEKLGPQESDAFDIVLADRVNRRKCVLSTKFNALAKRGGLDGRVIEVQECVSLKNDSISPPQEFLLLNKFTVSPKSFPKITGTAFPPEATENEKKAEPLCGTRRYYLHLLNNDDYLQSDARWHTNSAIGDIGKALQKEDLVSIREVFSKFKDNIKLPLMGRVFKKSRLLNYGKRTDNKDAYPMNFSFSLADHEDIVEVTVWNDLCISLFEHLEVGQTLYFENYKFFKANDKPLNYKISLNPKGPTAVVKSFSEEDVNIDEEEFEQLFPPREFSFGSRSKISLLADDMELDIVGAIVYAGRIQRERNGSAFGESRWVGLLLDDSEEPTFLKLYTCSQVHIFDKVAVGGVLFASKVKVSSYTADSFQPRVVFLTTQWTTQLQFWKDLDAANQAAHIPDCIAHIDFEGNDKKKVIGEGGFFDLQIPFPSLKKLKAELGGDDLVIPFEELEAVRERLEIFEKRVVILQGVVSQIQFGVQKRDSESAAKEKKKQPGELTVLINRTESLEIVHNSSSTLHLAGQVAPDGTVAISPVSITLCQFNGKKGLQAFAPAMFVGPTKFNAAVDGFCTIFPDKLDLQSSLDTKDPLARLSQMCKDFLVEKRVATLVNLYRPSPDEVEIVITKVFQLP